MPSNDLLFHAKYCHECSWKVQLEKNEKLERFKLESLKLDLKLDPFFYKFNFFWPFQLLFYLSNFNGSFPITLFISKLDQNCSSVTFKLHPELSNFSPDFLTLDPIFQFHVGLSCLKLSNFWFFPIALSNYIYPHVFNRYAMTRHAIPCNGGLK